MNVATRRGRAPAATGSDPPAVFAPSQQACRSWRRALRRPGRGRAHESCSGPLARRTCRRPASCGPSLRGYRAAGARHSHAPGHSSSNTQPRAHDGRPAASGASRPSSTRLPSVLIEKNGHSSPSSPSGCLWSFGVETEGGRARRWQRSAAFPAKGPSVARLQDDGCRSRRSCPPLAGCVRAGPAQALAAGRGAERPHRRTSPPSYRPGTPPASVCAPGCRQCPRTTWRQPRVSAPTLETGWGCAWWRARPCAAAPLQPPCPAPPG